MRGLHHQLTISSAKSDILGPKLDSNSLSMVHIEMGPAAAASSSTEMLDPIPGTWSPGDEPGDRSQTGQSYCTSMI